ELHYQPQMDINGSLVGAEALVRWRRSDGVMVPPGEFIPVAEESGLIKPIGDWVLRNACVQARRWTASGLAPLLISVNLSTRQFEQHEFSAYIETVLRETGLDPGLLDLEITESMTMNEDRALGILVDLKNLGVRISMDDFGTGYSSLS